MSLLLRTRFCVVPMAVLAVCLTIDSRPKNSPRLAGPGQSSDRSAAQPGQNINDVLNAALKPDADRPVQIAPMTKQGDPTPGEFTNVQGGIFDAIFNRIGIDPNKTNPADVQNKDGFLEYIDGDNSMVLNPGGTRATFGYFIRFTQTVQEFRVEGEYFALFSYDKIKDPDNPNASIVATEFFLFGPFFRSSNGTINSLGERGPDLALAVAVGADGKLLPSVPLSLAAVSNFPDFAKKEEHKGEPVKPGTNQKGCLECHGFDAKFPQSTTPFPWVGLPKPTEAVAGQATPNPSATPAPEGGDKSSGKDGTSSGDKGAGDKNSTQNAPPAKSESSNPGSQNQEQDKPKPRRVSSAVTPGAPGTAVCAASAPDPPILDGQSAKIEIQFSCVATQDATFQPISFESNISVEDPGSLVLGDARTPDALSFPGKLTDSRTVTYKLPCPKDVDLASAPLYQACIMGASQAPLKTLPKKTPSYLNLTIKDVKVSTVSLSSGESEPQPTESVHLNFSAINMMFTPNSLIVPMPAAKANKVSPSPSKDGAAGKSAEKKDSAATQTTAEATSPGGTSAKKLTPRQAYDKAVQRELKAAETLIQGGPNVNVTNAQNEFNAAVKDVEAAYANLLAAEANPSPNTTGTGANAAATSTTGKSQANLATGGLTATAGDGGVVVTIPETGNKEFNVQFTVTVSDPNSSETGGNRFVFNTLLPSSPGQLTIFPLLSFGAQNVPGVTIGDIIVDGAGYPAGGNIENPLRITTENSQNTTGTPLSTPSVYVPHVFVGRAKLFHMFGYYEGFRAYPAVDATNPTAQETTTPTGPEFAPFRYGNTSGYFAGLPGVGVGIGYTSSTPGASAPSQSTTNPQLLLYPPVIPALTPSVPGVNVTAPSATDPVTSPDGRNFHIDMTYLNTLASQANGLNLASLATTIITPESEPKLNEYGKGKTAVKIIRFGASVHFEPVPETGSNVPLVVTPVVPFNLSVAPDRAPVAQPSGIYLYTTGTHPTDASITVTVDPLATNAQLVDLTSPNEPVIQGIPVGGNSFDFRLGSSLEPIGSHLFRFDIGPYTSSAGTQTTGQATHLTLEAGSPDVVINPPVVLLSPTASLTASQDSNSGFSLENIKNAAAASHLGPPDSDASNTAGTAEKAKPASNQGILVENPPGNVIGITPPAAPPGTTSTTIPEFHIGLGFLSKDGNRSDSSGVLRIQPVKGLGNGFTYAFVEHDTKFGRDVVVDNGGGFWGTSAVPFGSMAAFNSGSKQEIPVQCEQRKDGQATCDLSLKAALIAADTDIRPEDAPSATNRALQSFSYLSPYLLPQLNLGGGSFTVDVRAIDTSAGKQLQFNFVPQTSATPRPPATNAPIFQGFSFSSKGASAPYLIAPGNGSCLFFNGTGMSESKCTADPPLDPKQVNVFILSKVLAGETQQPPTYFYFTPIPAETGTNRFFIQTVPLTPVGPLSVNIVPSTSDSSHVDLNFQSPDNPSFLRLLGISNTSSIAGYFGNGSGVFRVEGYDATTGYDLASGLGAVDASALVRSSVGAGGGATGGAITPKPAANPSLKFDFNNLQITSVRSSGTGESPSEALTIPYTKVEFNYSSKPAKQGNQPVALDSLAAAVAIQQSPSDERGLDASLHRPVPDHDGSRGRANPYLQLAAFHSGDGPQALAPGTLVRLVPTSQSSSQAAPQAAAPISFSFVANGNASGEAFELRVVDPSGKLQEIRAPDGLILEPLERGSVIPVSAGPGQKLVSRKLNAYCVKYDEDPPEPDAIYRVAAPEIQEQYKPIRSVMRAGRELAAAGKFHPDTDATAYIISIRQYALWTKLENWNEEKFGEVFREKTKKIAEDSKIPWTKELDQALRALVPGRWRDISMVLEQARKLEAADASPPR